jgi:starvation-inducible DNA-binding protein
VSKAKSDKVSPDLDTPTDLPQAAVDKISAALNTLLADAFALYLKTKNFHWHVSGRHFRDYHLMLDEQSDAIFATTDQARRHHDALDRADREIADHQGQ